GPTAASIILKLQPFDSPIIVKDDAIRGMFLPDIDTFLSGIIQQDCIELHSFDLVGIRCLILHSRGPRKIKRPRLCTLSPAESASKLAHEISLFQILSDPEHLTNSMNGCRK